jgi:hypothetical protein
MYDLSILMPGIRTQFWEDIYNKFEKYLTKNSWELVIVGPYSLPKELESKRNIKYVKDFGSPIRCQQIGLILSEGEFITWTSDDGVPLEGALEEAFYDLNEGTILSGKYYEGEGTDHIMSNPGYYLLGNNGMMRG